MFSENKFSMIALILDEKDEEKVVKKQILAMKNRPTKSKFSTLYKKSMDNETTFCVKTLKNLFDLLLNKLERHSK